MAHKTLEQQGWVSAMRVRVFRKGRAFRAQTHVLGQEVCGWEADSPGRALVALAITMHKELKALAPDETL